MPRRINGPQNREQLQMMVEAVRGEVNLAQDLLDSYEQDLANLEADTTLTAKNKESRRVFLETAIKESRDLLNLRQKQLKSIDPMRGGKAAGQARREVWNDTTIESKGMNAIMQEKSNIVKEEKHTQDISKLQAERQARSEAVRNAATTLASAAVKLSNERQSNNENKIPSFIDGADKWILRDKNKAGSVFIYENPNNNKIRYIYYPELSEVVQSEKIGEKLLNTVYDINSKEWLQIPNNILREKGIHYNQATKKWEKYDFIRKEWDTQENGTWFVPVYDEKGNLLYDANGKVILKNVSDEEMQLEGAKTEEQKAKLAEKIMNNVLSSEEVIDTENLKNVTPEDLGKFTMEDQKNAYGYKGLQSSDDAITKYKSLNIFQKLKFWFMRLFNKKYQLPVASKFSYNKSNNIDLRKQKMTSNEIENNKKRTIRGYYLPKIKQSFKDNKRKIMAISALAIATIAMAWGINERKEYNKELIEQQAAIEEQQHNIEEQQKLEEQQAISDAMEQQSMENETEQQQEDALVKQDAKTLTTGSVNKQYVAEKGLEYTENALGKGNRGTLPANTVVEIFNRAIVKENNDGTRQIILTAKGKTWEDVCKESGMSIEEIQNLLNQDKTYEMAAIQVGGTNHNIFNTYGWVKTSDLEKSSKDTENLKDFEITQGDNTEILQQLQQKENQIRQAQEER